MHEPNTSQPATQLAPQTSDLFFVDDNWGYFSDPNASDAWGSGFSG